jgi:uncharacterized DUF497 family protein
MLVLTTPLQFEWDEGNRHKNSTKHDVTNEECEEVFFDNDKKILKDRLHSGSEERYILIGKTNQNRLLFIALTMRKSRIRVISARDLNKKERNLYEKQT